MTKRKRQDWKEETPRDWSDYTFPSGEGLTGDVEHDARVFMEQEGPGFFLQIERDAQTIARDGLDVSFSQEAIRKMARSVALFVTTRLIKEKARAGVYPQQMRLFIGVEFPDTRDQ